MGRAFTTKNKFWLMGMLFLLAQSFISFAQDADSDIEELNQHREAQAKKMEDISMGQALSGNDPNGIAIEGESEKVPSFGDQFTLSPNFLENIKKQVNQQTPELISNALRSRLTHPGAQDFFNRFPKVLDFIGHWYAGPEKAFEKFLSILEKKDALKTYGFTALAIFIVGQILGAFPPKKNILIRLLYKLFITFLAVIFMLGSFVYIFKAELTPSYQVAKRIWDAPAQKP